MKSEKNITEKWFKIEDTAALVRNCKSLGKVQIHWNSLRSEGLLFMYDSSIQHKTNSLKKVHWLVY